MADEAELVARSLVAIVDIGSNGVRFSISSTAAHHARVLPCVFKDRVGVSLFDAQLSDTANVNCKSPIPSETIDEICHAMQRFKLICDDFGVPEAGVKVVATEATREAANSQEFQKAIFQATGWKVELLEKEEEGKCGAFGVASSFQKISGLFMDLGGGSTQIAWISNVGTGGKLLISELPVSLPYGAAALTHRLKFEDRRDIYSEIQQSYSQALEKIAIPPEMMQAADDQGGFDVYTCGGGFRGLGHLLLSQDPDYPIQTIINGYSAPIEKVQSMCDFLLLRRAVPNLATKIFKVSERRKQQLPAVGLLLSAALQSLPKIRTVHFSEGGVREGVLYSMIPDCIRAEDPLITATQPYAPLLVDRYLAILRNALPQSLVPEEVFESIAPALCNVAFVHCSYPKELQPTASLHLATTGIIAGCNGLSHKARALIGIACCERWGAEIPESQEKFYSRLEIAIKQADTLQGESLIYWSKYCGTIMHVICGVHPGGNIRPGAINFSVTGEKVAVLISPDDVKTSSSVKSRIGKLQKKIKKLNKRSEGDCKAKIVVKYTNE